MREQPIPPYLHAQKSKPLERGNFLNRLLRGMIQKGSLRLIGANGSSEEFGDGLEPFVTIRIYDPGLAWLLPLSPSIHFGEAYMDGRLALEQGDLRDLFALLYQNPIFREQTYWNSWVDRAFQLLRSFSQINSRFAAKRNARHHYNLSDSFYRLFLDPERQYSCAYFTTPTLSLEEAQRAKMNLILKKLSPARGHRVLDIGCGWGGLACHIARSTGASVTGITLAEEQLNFARERARREQLENLVSFELLDYRDLKGSFDRIVSVGMFEHVGVGFYSEFFQKLHALLAENGVALLHSIGRSTGPSYTDPWIRKYIFPGGYVPALSEVLPHVEKSSLYVTDLEILRMHYAYTLKEWRKRFRENWNTSAALYDERFCRMWDLYLAGAEASFEHLGHMVFHLQMAKAHSTLPITREYMLKSEKADPIS